MDHRRGPCLSSPIFKKVTAGEPLLSLSTKLTRVLKCAYFLSRIESRHGKHQIEPTNSHNSWTRHISQKQKQPPLLKLSQCFNVRFERYLSS